jgi:hypothetical protein
LHRRFFKGIGVIRHLHHFPDLLIIGGVDATILLAPIATKLRTRVGLRASTTPSIGIPRQCCYAEYYPPLLPATVQHAAPLLAQSAR